MMQQEIDQSHSETLIWLLLFGAGHLTDTGLEVPTDEVKRKKKSMTQICGMLV